jgi:hypothetical protein
MIRSPDPNDLAVAALPVLAHWRENLAGMLVEAELRDADGAVVARDGDPLDHGSAGRADALVRHPLDGQVIGTITLWNPQPSPAALLAAIAREAAIQISSEILIAAHRGSRIEAVEYAAVAAALRETGGNRLRTAELLGIGRTTLYRKLQAFGLDHERMVS